MKAEKIPHEHTGEGPSRNEKKIRKTAEGLGHSIGVLDDSAEEFSFQALNETYDNMDEVEYRDFLKNFWNYDDLATPQNTELVEDPQHGLYVKIRLEE
jgi:hypothetical protein